MTYTVTTNYVADLLLSGYAAGVSVFAWGEIRVFPNLCVLGVYRRNSEMDPA